MTNEAYHGDTTKISKSGLDLINRSPYHYWDKYLNLDKPPISTTPALEIGTAVHSCVLEPDDFDRLYVVSPKFDKRTKAGKEGYEEFLAQVVAKKQRLIDADDYETCMRMRDAVWKHPAAKILLNEGDAEQTYYFDEFQTDAPCKMRPDFISSQGVIVDLKTTENASPAGFGSSAFNYRYHVQAAFYLDGYLQSTGEMMESFIFIAVEKSRPNAVGVYMVDDDIVHLGRTAYLRNLETYMECLETGKWPAYGEAIRPLQLPAWALKQL